MLSKVYDFVKGVLDFIFYMIDKVFYVFYVVHLAIEASVVVAYRDSNRLIKFIMLIGLIGPLFCSYGWISSISVVVLSALYGLHKSKSHKEIFRKMKEVIDRFSEVQQTGNFCLSYHTGGCYV